MKKYSKEWVLQDTINFYTLENRALDRNGNCQYLTEDGKRCAIGRYLKKGLEKNLKNCSDGALLFLESCFFEEIIPKWMRKLPVSFLQHVQLLHDTQYNWTSTGLSEKGVNKVYEICENYHISFNSLTIKR